MQFDLTTFVLQLVNLVVLLVILRHLLFRPVAAMIARRQAETDAALAGADMARAKAEAARAEAQAEAAATAAARDAALEAARAEAAALKDDLLHAARAEAARLIAEGQTQRQRETVAAEARALARAAELATDIARRALAAQPQGLAGYAGRLADALTAMPAPERAALLAGGKLRLVTPAALSEADLAMVRAVLARAGVTVQEVTTDPGLIAGLELQTETGAVRNSVAHDLTRMAEALRDDRNG